jgi:hypothetical protein
VLQKEGFTTSAANFRNSSKDAKGQQSTKNLTSNLSPSGPFNKKPLEDKPDKAPNNFVHS